MQRRICSGFACLTLLILAGSTRAAEFHAAPGGSARGQGSKESPWDLATALAAAETVKPGDTVWLHGGTFRGGFVSQLRGRPDAPIVVRSLPGARVTIDTQPRDERDNGLFVIRGADVVFRDFEVTCSHPVRVTKTPGSWPAEIRRGSVDVRGDRVALWNLVVHDCGSGFGLWAEGEGGEVSGCLIYNNGWRGPDRGHGHAIYAQNARGTKRIRDNVIFHQFGYGVHVYGSAKASLKGFDIEGNIIFENGCLAREGDIAPGIMVGGAAPAERITVRDNVVLGGIRLGYPWGTTSEDVVCTGNYVDGPLVVRDFRTGTIAKNTVVAHSNVVQLEGEKELMRAGLRWDDNDYYITDGRWGQCSVVEGKKSRGMSFDDWRGLTGFDGKSTFKKGSPSNLRVIVRPNTHEKGRAHVAILNPDALPEVDVDLSGVLTPGQRFRIVSAKDVFGRPLASGVFDGKVVRVPTKSVTPPAPVGMADARFPVTEPRFLAVVVLPEE